MNGDMEEKGTVARDCFSLPAARLGAACCPGSGRRPTRSALPFSSMSRFSLLQIDVEVEEPETSENPTQSLEVHNIVWSRTQILAVIIYII